MADAPDPMSLRELVKNSYENSAAHGFWDNEEVPETIPNKLMLIVSELSEALESYRDPAADDMVKVPADLLATLIEWAGIDNVDETKRYKACADAQAILDKWKVKPKGFDTELADAFIRLGDLCGAKGIDIDAAIRRKHEYNVSRPHMHGRKV